MVAGAVAKEPGISGPRRRSVVLRLSRCLAPLVLVTKADALPISIIRSGHSLSAEDGVTFVARKTALGDSALIGLVFVSVTN